MSCFRVILVVATMLVPLSLQSQGERYHHPVYDISFVATSNWTEQLPVSRSGAYSVVNPNRNMVISLAYIPDCKRPMKYLRKLSGFKGMACKRDGYDTLLNEQDALIFCGNSLEIRESFTTMVIGFPSDKGLYLMEIRCPDNCQAAHQQTLKSILETVRIGKDSAI